MLTEKLTQPPHEFVRGLTADHIGLVVKRDTDCRGSWEEVMTRVSRDYLPVIAVLQEYERKNQVNLGAFVRAYLSENT